MGEAMGKRWEALDGLRGLAVFAMVPVNAAADFQMIPAWFKHAPGTGITLVDLVMPTFLFALGLSASFSLKKRIETRGLKRALLHGLVRSAILFALGLIGNILIYGGTGWEVMQMLGCASLLALPLCLVPAWPRMGAAVLILIAVELARPMGLGELLRGAYATGLGGVWGSLSLAALAVAASGIGDLLRAASPRKRLLFPLAAGACFLLLALGFSTFGSDRTIDKHIVTAPYLLVSAAIASGFLSLCELASRIAPFVLGLWIPLGKNPFLFYILSGILVLALHALFPPGITAAAAFGLSFAVLALCLAAAFFLDRKRWYLKL